MGSGPPSARGFTALSGNAGGGPLHQSSVFGTSRPRTRHEANPGEK
ncbi:MAG: hypothetical protein ACFFD2_04875 [Promethearchaeota archaeon]